MNSCNDEQTASSLPQEIALSEKSGIARTLKLALAGKRPEIKRTMAQQHLEPAHGMRLLGYLCRESPITTYFWKFIISKRDK